MEMELLFVVVYAFCLGIPSGGSALLVDVIVLFVDFGWNCVAEYMRPSAFYYRACGSWIIHEIALGYQQTCSFLAASKCEHCSLVGLSFHGLVIVRASSSRAAMSTYEKCLFSTRTPDVAHVLGFAPATGHLLGFAGRVFK